MNFLYQCLQRFDNQFGVAKVTSELNRNLKPTTTKLAQNHTALITNSVNLAQTTSSH